MTLYVAEIYDDRHPKDYVERSDFKHSDPEYVMHDARRLLNGWADPDNGVRPIHLCSRIMKIETDKDEKETVSEYV